MFYARIFKQKEMFEGQTYNVQTNSLIYEGEYVTFKKIRMLFKEKTCLVLRNGKIWEKTQERTSIPLRFSIDSIPIEKITSISRVYLKDHSTEASLPSHH